MQSNKKAMIIILIISFFCSKFIYGQNELIGNYETYNKFLFRSNYSTVHHDELVLKSDSTFKLYIHGEDIFDVKELNGVFKVFKNKIILTESKTGKVIKYKIKSNQIFKPSILGFIYRKVFCKIT